MSILKEYNIPFVKEYSFPDRKDRRYDFAILNTQGEPARLIEFDGLQHFYKPRAEHWSSTITLEETQERDREKNRIAQERNVQLIRIPYWHLEKINVINLLDDTYLITEVNYE